MAMKEHCHALPNLSQESRTVATPPYDHNTSTPSSLIQGLDFCEPLVSDKPSNDHGLGTSEATTRTHTRLRAFRATLVL